MNSFDIVMEKLTNKDREEFVKRDQTAKKIVSEFTSRLNNVIKYSKAADKYIKAHPNCKDEWLEDGETDNLEFAKASELVYKAYNEIDDIQILIWRLKKAPMGKASNAFATVGGVGIIATLLSTILIPFLKKYAAIAAGASAVITGASFAGWIKSDASDDAKWKEKEMEWRKENPDNSIGKLADIEKTIDGIKDDMYDKYYYWLG